MRRELLTQETLANGIRVLLKENQFSPAVAIQAWVGVGSLDEGPDQRGMAHFIEHMLFKGTERRGVGEIAAAVEAAGGDINAYTTFDHTVFHLTLASPHAALGVDLLHDAIAHSRFDAEEFEREREVILEEIRRSEDSPGAIVGRRVFELCFSGTEAGRAIIGDVASVRAFTRDALYQFYQTWYQSHNVTLVIAGAFETASMLAQVRQTFGTMPDGKAPPRASFKPLRMTHDAPRVSILRGDFQQPRVELVFPAPSLLELDATALDLAAFALGTGEMSRLSRRLRDAEGLVTSAGASVYTPLFGGVFELSALMPEATLPAAIAGLAREVALLREHEPVNDEELARARANLRADRYFRDETVDGQARTLGFGMLTPHGALYDEVYSTLVNEMPGSLVQRAVKRWLRPERATLVVLVNNASALSETAVLEAFKAGTDAGEGRQPVAPPATPASARRVPKASAEVFDLRPGLRLIYRCNPQSHLFTMTAATEGGLRAESADLAGIGHAISGMLALAAEGLPYEELMSVVEGRGASLEGFSGKDSLGFHLQSLTEHADEMARLLRACLLRPVFPEEQWNALRREIAQVIATQGDSPANVCLRRFQELIFGDHPYRYPIVGTAESVETLSAPGLLAAFESTRDGGPWVIAAAGPEPTQVVQARIEALVEGFMPVAERRRFPSEALVEATRAQRQRIHKDREQCHIVYGFRGITWGDPDRPALDVLINILGGHGGRLFRELRDKDSLAYTVSPIISYGCHPGVVGSYIACAPSKAERAAEALSTNMLRLAEEGVAAAELERARNYIVGTHDLSLQKSDSQTSTMALMDLYGYGYDDFLRYPEAIATINAEDVKRVAQRLFKPESAVSVIVGPQ